MWVDNSYWITGSADINPLLVFPEAYKFSQLDMLDYSSLNKVDSFRDVCKVFMWSCDIYKLQRQYSVGLQIQGSVLFRR